MTYYHEGPHLPQKKKKSKEEQFKQIVNSAISISNIISKPILPQPRNLC